MICSSRGTLHKPAIVVSTDVAVDADNSAAGLIYVVLDLIGAAGGRLVDQRITLFQHADSQMLVDTLGFDRGKSCLRRGPHELSAIANSPFGSQSRYDRCWTSHVDTSNFFRDASIIAYRRAMQREVVHNVR